MAQHLSWHPSMVRAKGSHQTVPVPSRRQQHATGALHWDHGRHGQKKLQTTLRDPSGNQTLHIWKFRNPYKYPGL